MRCLGNARDATDAPEIPGFRAAVLQVRIHFPPAESHTNQIVLHVTSGTTRLCEIALPMGRKWTPALFAPCLSITHRFLGYRDRSPRGARVVRRQAGDRGSATWLSCRQLVASDCKSSGLVGPLRRRGDGVGDVAPDPSTGYTMFRTVTAGCCNNRGHPAGAPPCPSSPRAVARGNLATQHHVVHGIAAIAALGGRGGKLRPPGCART
jgi:hypothetical protein